MNIPWEVLSSIFEANSSNDPQTVEEPDFGEYSIPTREKSALPFEVVASHVNSVWRKVALGTRSLWNTIFIQPGISPSAVETYLERSGSSMLDIIIVCDEQPHNDQGLQKMLDLALKHTNRWGRCWFDSHREDIDSPVISRLVPIGAPALEYLSIAVEFSDRFRPAQNEPFFPQIFGGGCPRLSFLRLRGLAIYFFRPPLRAVTTLYIDHTKWMRVRYDEFRAILLSCPGLLNLSIGGDIIGGQPWLEDNSIELPTLQTLAISSFQADNFSNILITIDAPRLGKIVLKDAREHDLDHFLLSPHSLKFPLLHSLVFCDSEFTVLKYHEFFKSFPSVSELTFMGGNDLASFLRNISDAAYFSPQLVQGCPRVLWPELRTLNIDLNLGCEEDLPLLDALERRMQVGHGIVKLRLGTSEMDDLEDDLEDTLTAEWLQEHITIEVIKGADFWRLCRI
ncbi:hypothetical protein L218DRAFT_902524 [Marasmius fiardii PR-910]|nr:hypothetical protein L218DRAFT_902524 [Marasmius fiardii PR-910]